MGYCYTLAGALVCDKCGNSGGVRKRTCPYGYCQSPALCPVCWRSLSEKGTWFVVHAGCKQPAEDWKAREAEEKRRHAAGEYLRSSAIGIDVEGEPWGTTVEVTFTNAAGQEQIWHMPQTVYRAIPLLEIAAPGDFQKHGLTVQVSGVPYESV